VLSGSSVPTFRRIGLTPSSGSESKSSKYFPPFLLGFLTLTADNACEENVNNIPSICHGGLSPPPHYSYPKQRDTLRTFPLPSKLFPFTQNLGYMVMESMISCVWLSSQNFPQFPFIVSRPASSAPSSVHSKHDRVFSNAF
jgi:hypothetical protein